MSDGKKADLEHRIEENQRKIEEISAFRDDPKIDKIIRVLQKQIARDTYELSLWDYPSRPCGSEHKRDNRRRRVIEECGVTAAQIPSMGRSSPAPGIYRARGRVILSPWFFLLFHKPPRSPSKALLGCHSS